MARHRGVFKSDNPSPFELSRGAIENMVRCPACFWLEKVKGVKTPRMPGFNLNSNTDTLLKKDFKGLWFAYARRGRVAARAAFNAAMRLLSRRW